MMTNVIACLHTTLAYQSAALQVMVGQANFDAQQLHLQEPLPIVAPASTNNWKVAMPPYGVTGQLTSSNYIYRFTAGRLLWIQKKAQAHPVPVNAFESDPVTDPDAAYQLARQWLTAISVDVPALESKYSHTVTHPGNRPQVLLHGMHNVNNPTSGHEREHTNAVHLAGDVAARFTRSETFFITWRGGNDSPSSHGHEAGQLSIMIDGATRQCTGLRIYNPELLKAPPLQVANADTLLGAPPPPQHFVAEFLGGQTAYDTVARPDRILASLVIQSADDPNVSIERTAAVAVDAATAALFSRTLTDFNSYAWIHENPCTPKYGVHLRFSKGTDLVDTYWYHDCDHLLVVHNGRSADQDCDTARAALVKAVQAVFPRDEIIKTLPLSNPVQSN
jgi:hypothetical protein